MISYKMYKKNLISSINVNVRPPKMSVSGFSSENLGMVGRHNILFYRNILYRNCIFQYFYPHFSANLTTFC